MHGAGTTPTWGEIAETLTLRAGFNTTTVIVGTTLLGLAAGVVGVFALLRKRSLTADALSHATLPGITIAFLGAAVLGLDGRSLPVLLTGAAVSGVMGVVCIQAMLRHTRLREDAAIGIVLSVFFGVGIVGLSYIQSNAAAGAAGLHRLIYGQTATITAPNAALMGGVALLAVLATLTLYKEFTLVCFNDAFARVDGWAVSVVDLTMMALVVIVTVVGLQAVGILLVVAMLIIPPVAARFWTDRLSVLIVLAGVIGALSGYLGSALSALLPGLPAGAVIVLSAGVFFAISMALAPRRGVLAIAARRVRVQVRIAGDHVLEEGHELATPEGATIPRARLDAIAHERGWTPWLRALVSRTLRSGGLISAGPEAIALTPAGLARGARVSRNHKLWEQYLVSYADIAPSHVDWSVDQVEHVLSDGLIAELEAALVARGVAVPAHSPDAGVAL